MSARWNVQRFNNTDNETAKWNCFLLSFCHVCLAWNIVLLGRHKTFKCLVVIKNTYLYNFRTYDFCFGYNLSGNLFFLIWISDNGIGNSVKQSESSNFFFRTSVIAPRQIWIWVQTSGSGVGHTGIGTFFCVIVQHRSFTKHQPICVDIRKRAMNCLNMIVGRIRPSIENIGKRSRRHSEFLRKFLLRQTHGIHNLPDTFSHFLLLFLRFSANLRKSRIIYKYKHRKLITKT